MTNREMLETAMRQSAIDMGCDETDYLKDTNVIKPLILGVNARKYLKEPITCNLVSYAPRHHTNRACERYRCAVYR